MAPKQQSSNGMSTAYPHMAPSKKAPLAISAVGVVIILVLIFTSTSADSALSVSGLSNSAKSAAKHIPQPKLPHLPALNIHSPFRTVHEPPVQKNSTSGEAKWFSDWKWLNPFSSSITLDEDRSVLPPLKTRPHIYTYYDPNLKSDEDTREAENKLLLIWRRAWWAQGFKPVILSRAEATNNPLYESLQGQELDPALEAEIMRWLAWGHMGTGILANWLILPMGPHDDNLLSYLRRGQYPKLTRYESLSTGLFSGDHESIKAALSQILSSPGLSTSKSFLEAIPDQALFSVDPKPSSIAFYDSSTLTSTYKPVADAIMLSRSTGLLSLAGLITHHLHTTFQSTFTSGLTILVPQPYQTTTLALPALALANALIACPGSPIPYSCPPNNPKCRQCSSSPPLDITFSSSYTNSTTMYTIGVIPHSYTHALLLAKQKILTIRYVRRSMERDPWVNAVTLETMGKDIGGSARIVGFKEKAASEWGSRSSAWGLAEVDWDWRDLEWHFGFELSAHNTSDNAKNSKEVETRNRGMEKLLAGLEEAKQPTKQDIGEQKELLTTGKDVVNKESKEKMQDVVEAWNLVDTEAWRFVRAFNARARVERLKWEEEEKGFIGGEDKGEGWGKWFERD